MKKIIVTLCCWLVCSCAADEKIENMTKSTINNSVTPESIYNIKLNDQDLNFSVISFGCTKKSHFRLDYTQVNDLLVEITVVRLKPDFCKKKPELKSFHLKLKKLPNEESTWKIGNPLL